MPYDFYNGEKGATFLKKIFIQPLSPSLDARVISKTRNKKVLEPIKHVQLFNKISFRRIIGLILSVLGLILILLAFIIVKPVMSYYAPQYRTEINALYPAGVYYMEGWYAPKGTILVFEWSFNRSVHVYVVEQNIFNEGMPFSDYLAHTYAEEDSITVYVDKKGEYVFAVYSPEAFLRYYSDFRAIHPIAEVKRNYMLAYFGAFVSLIGILVLIFPKRWRNSTS